MKFQKEMLQLYAVTDRVWTEKQTLEEQIEQALRGGVTMVQLREKNLDDETFLQEAVRVQQLCSRYGVPLIINDNVDVALKCGADGVHVGAEDQAVEEIRKRVPAEFIIGATCKTVVQAKKAEQAGADYMGVGAVFLSSTKKNALRITKEQLCEICSSVEIPAVAIGGISKENLMELAGTGIAGVALVSAIFAAEDIQKECSVLRCSIDKMLAQK